MIAALALSAIIVENVLTRRLLENRQRFANTTAKLVAGIPPAEFQKLVADEALGAAIRGEESVGPDALVSRLERADPGQTSVITVDGRPWVAAGYSSDGSATMVAVEAGSIAVDVARARNMMSVFLLLVVVVVLAFGYGFFGLLILRPVRAIRVATERAAEGDLASPIGVVPRNEFGRVARSFNGMLERLDRNRAQLERKVEELQEANRELAETRDSLVRSEKLASVGELAAGIAHEIGNPLAALSGYNELLQGSELDPEETEEILERSGAQLERIRTVIRNLLDFSRDDAGGPPAATELASCVAETRQLVSALPAARKVEFEVDDLAGPAVRAVGPRVVQVLVNLTMNALDAMEEGGTVRIERRDSDARTELFIIDDGPGIHPDDLSRLFDPFFTTKDPGEGTGLGLAISARIMESFDGALRAENVEGGGACFIMEFRHHREDQ